MTVVFLLTLASCLGFLGAVLLVVWATKGMVNRKDLDKRKIELIMAPTPRYRVDHDTMAHLARDITGRGTQEALPGKANGAVTRYLIGEVDAWEMEALLDARINEAVINERHSIPKGMAHSNPQEFPPTPKTRKER